MDSLATSLSSWLGHWFGQKKRSFDEYFETIDNRRNEVRKAYEAVLLQFASQPQEAMIAIGELQAKHCLADQIGDLRNLTQAYQASDRVDLVRLETAVHLVLSTIADVLLVTSRVGASTQRSTQLWAFIASDYFAALRKHKDGVISSFEAKYPLGSLATALIAHRPIATSAALSEVGIDVPQPQQDDLTDAINVYRFVWREIVPPTISISMRFGNTASSLMIEEACAEIADLAEIGNRQQAAGE